MKFNIGDAVWISINLVSTLGIVENRVPNTNEYIIRINGTNMQCRNIESIFLYKEECDSHISCIIDSMNEANQKFNEKQQSIYRDRISSITDLINFAARRIVDKNAKVVFIEKAEQLLGVSGINYR